MTSETKSEAENASTVGENGSTVAVNGSKDAQESQEEVVEGPIRLTIKISPTEQFEYQTTEKEVGGEIFQLLKDRESTCHKTCYTIRHNGNIVDIYGAITAIPGINGGVLEIRDEPYSLREARNHIRHVVELLNPRTLDDTLSRASGKDCVGMSYLATLDVYKDDSSKNRKSLDTNPPDYALPGVKEPSLAHLLPKIEKVPRACKNIAISPFNPPPGPRKLKGDVLYIDVELENNKTLYITCCTQGFYVNASTEDVFNPNQSNQFKTVFVTLIDLLNFVSPTFKKAYYAILESKNTISAIENYSQHHPISWFAPQKKEQEMFLEDSQRAEDVTNIARLGIEGLVPDQMPGSMRDWNDELRFLKDMNKDNFDNSILQERCYGRAHLDFVNAAVKGACHVAEGNVPSLNPADEKKIQMYIYHNIFFGLGWDVKDHYKDFGGDAAAFALMPIDLQGVRAYQYTNKSQIYTAGLVIIDYLGQRITAQSIIPGILEKEQELTVLQGSLNHGKTIVVDERFEKLKESSEELRILPHDVIIGEGEEEKIVTLYTSYDTKGVIGDDTRMFILDLYRTNPPDANFIEDAELSPAVKAHGFPRKPPHQFFAVRRELIEYFVEFAEVRYFHAFSTAYKTAHDDENSPEDNDKKRTVLINVLKQNYDEITEPSAREAMKKAATVVNSAHEEKVDLRFNPDCFSKNVRHAPYENIERQQNLIKDLGEFLVTSQLPGLAELLLKCEITVVTGESLVNVMHLKGINVRYLGDLLKFVSAATKTYVKPLIASELVARSIKHVFRSFFFDLVLDTIAPAVIHLLNCLFGMVTLTNVQQSQVNGEKAQKTKKSNGSSKSTTKKRRQPSGGWSSITTESLWKLITDDAVSYYGYTIKQDSFKAFAEAFEFEKTALFSRICRMMGFQMVARDYQLDSGKNVLFTVDDLNDFFPIFKHQNPLSQESKRLFLEGQQNLVCGNLGGAYGSIIDAVNTMNFVYYQMHPELVNAYSTLARLTHVLEQDQNDALNYQSKATLISERTTGLTSTPTILEYVNLAHMAFQTQKQASALKLLYRARYVLTVVFGERHPLMAQIDANIGLIQFYNEEYELAQRYLQSSRKISNEIGEPKTWKNAISLNLLARTLAYRGDFRTALIVEKETNQIYESLFGIEDIRTIESNNYLKALTKQAVEMQIKLRNDGKRSSIKDLYHIEAASFVRMRELMKIVNGFYVRSHETDHLVIDEQGNLKAAKKEEELKLQSEEELKLQSEEELKLQSEEELKLRSEEALKLQSEEELD